MKLKQLKYFVCVAKHLHFAKAAEELGITQPPLSRQIQLLEQTLGFELFSRTNKWQVSLTVAGKTFLDESEKILKQLCHAEKLAKSINEGINGHLKIGVISAIIGNSKFADALVKMRNKYPNVSVEIYDSVSSKLLEKLKENEIDIAFMRPFKEEIGYNFISEVLYNDKLNIVLPLNHHLSKYDKIPLNTLKNENFILNPKTKAPYFYEYIINFCKEKGKFTPHIWHESNSSYSALQLTAAGLGITIVSSTYAQNFTQKVIYRDFLDFEAKLPVMIVYPEFPTSPLIKNFLEILRVFFAG